MLGGQQWAVTDAPGDTDGCARLRVKVTIPQPFPVLGGGLVSFLDRVPGKWTQMWSQSFVYMAVLLRGT